MVGYMFKTKQGIFLLIGTLLLVLGFVLQAMGESIGSLMFYNSMVFLGFFATKNAILETLSNKRLNVDLLMVLAALGASLIHYESEGAMLLFIFALSGLLEEYANKQSSNAIEALMTQVPTKAQKCLTNGAVVEVSVDSLAIGDKIIVPKGAQIPIDGKVDQKVIVNEAALTGEAIPVTKLKDEVVFAGTINEGNAFYLFVNKLSNETMFSNIINMVEEAQAKPSKLSRLIDRIETKYVIAVLMSVPLLIGIFYFIQDLPFEEAFYRGMVFLTVASPCALVASATPATLAAISNGAKQGIVFKGGVAMEALASMTQLFSDKTGTVTYGQFEVLDYNIPSELLAKVIHMEQQSTHPIAKAIVKHFENSNITKINQQITVEEIAGKGLKSGNLFIGKVSASDERLLADYSIGKIDAHQTVVFVTQHGKIVGHILLEDRIRKEAKKAICEFQSQGVKVSLLTGDHQKVSKIVANTVGINDVYADLLPQHKIEHIQRAKEDKQVIGMIGDGINDAPALASADIGIAMGSGSAIAMESADIVMVKNDLSKLVYGFQLSRKLNRMIIQNMAFAISVIIILVILNVIGILPLPIAVICHEGSTILVILNGLRLLKGI